MGSVSQQPPLQNSTFVLAHTIIMIDIKSVNVASFLNKFQPTRLDDATAFSAQLEELETRILPEKEPETYSDPRDAYSEQEDDGMGSGVDLENTTTAMDDKDYEDTTEDILTPFQRRQLELAQKIHSLEAQQLDERDWTMTGEVSARSRPHNSLLMLGTHGDEGIDFEKARIIRPEEPGQPGR